MKKSSDKTKAPRNYPRAYFHVSRDLEHEFSSRIGPGTERRIRTGAHFGTLAKRDLLRYWALLRSTLPTIGITREEFLQLSKLIKLISEPDSTVFYAQVQRANPGLSRSLLTKLKALDEAQTLSLIDAIERHGINPESGPFPED